jgi:GT2 family glycosyltransferase
VTDPPEASRPTVSAVVLAYRDEPWLEKAVYALLDSDDADVEVILVDNGCTDGAVDRLRDVDRVVHVGDGHNLGFSGGCNLGAAAAHGDYLALVNGDLLVEPSTLARLVDVAADETVGIAAGSVRLADDPELLNTAGNEIHFLGFSWVGHFGEPAAREAHARDVAGAMGALALLRRRVWEDLGEFEDRYFAFHEDAELSWRCWQRGLRVRYVPDAIGVHRYEFDRVAGKLYLAERNRLLFVLTCWETRTLAVLFPAFLAVELAVTAAAWRGGWLRQKVDGWRWLLTHAGWVRARRRHLQARRDVPDRELAARWTAHLDARNFPIPPALRPLDQLLAGYWSLAQRLLDTRP